MAANLIYEDWQEKDFELQLNSYIHRLNRLSTGGEKIKIFNFFFRPKKYSFGVLDKVKFMGRYNLRKIDLEEKTSEQTTKEYIDQIAGDYGHSLTEGLNIFDTKEGIVLSFLDINLKMQEEFYQFVGSKYKFNNFGQPSNAVTVPFIIHNEIKIRYAKLDDGSEILEIPMKNNEVSLVLKFNRKTVDEFCPLCDDVMTLKHFEGLMVKSRAKRKLVFPQFQIRTSMELKYKLASMMQSFDLKGDTFKRFKGEIVERPTGPRPLKRINPKILFKNTVFSNESTFVIENNSDKKFKIADAVQYMSLKVTAKFNSNHKDVEVPVTQASLDQDTNLETLIVDYPFTFYLIDIRKKIVLTAGKIVELDEIKFKDNDDSENSL